MHRIPLIVPAAIALLALARAPGAASAYTAEEHFDYPNGTDIEGQGGGSGWAGGDVWTSTANGSFIVTNFGLSYPNIATSGGSAVITPASTSASSTIFRNLAQPFTSNDVFYIGFIAQKTVADDNTRYFGVALYSNNVEQILIGQGSGSPNWTLNHAAVGPGTNTAVSGVSSQVESYLLAKFELNAVGLDTVTFWVNPDFSLTEAQAQGTAVGGTSYTTDINLGIINRIRIGGGGTNATQAVSPHWLDEILVTTDSPFAIPEPATVTLLLLGVPLLASLAARRRG